MEEVKVAEKRFEDYRAIIGPTAHAEAISLGRKLEGKRVAHVNATAYGGGVAELLHSVVSLQRDLGLDVHWFVMSGTTPFFEVTKSIHNGLQGADVNLSEESRSTYRKVNEANASEFEDEFDFVVIHDPQPAPFAVMREGKPGGRKGRWIWRCHIDLTSPNPSVVRFLSPFIEAYDAAIFSADSYIPPGIPLRNPVVAPPAIDPLSPKNRELVAGEGKDLKARFGFDPDRPVISQVGRFDPWKDPLGVIDAYRIVKKAIPRVQLLLIGSMARDDPEGWLWFERTARHAGEDEDIHMLTDLRGVGALEVNILQRETDVALVKSLREGFGLTVSESLWKGVPVVGGTTGGIALQVRDGLDGYLVSSIKQAAARTEELLLDGDRRAQLGRSGRERVRERFLITRYVQDYLRLFLKLSS